jgi:hypothetical protein
MTVQATPNHWTTDHVLDRCGATLNPPRFINEATEQANKDLIAGFMADLGTFVTDFLRQAQGIQNDKTLSQIGIAEKLEPVQRDFNQRFNDTLCKRIRTVQQQHFARVDKLYELPKEVVEGNEIILEMRSREIRDFLQGLPPAQRIRHLMDGGDPEVFRALESAPACMRLVEPEMLDRARLARVQRLRGNDVPALQDERLALQRIVGVFENMPKNFPWIKIIPGFLPMADDVLPERKELDPANVEMAA